MDIQIQPSTDENLLYVETSIASPSCSQQRPDENSSTANTTGKVQNVSVVESVQITTRYGHSYQCPTKLGQSSSTPD